MNKIGNKLLCKFDLTKIYIYLRIFLLNVTLKLILYLLYFIINCYQLSFT